MKITITWVLATILLYILLATAVMFSRQTTLNGVRAYDFDLMYKSISLYKKNDLHQKFKYVADELTINNGKTIFFPLAVLSENNCTENGTRTDKICRQFSNLEEFKKETKNKQPRDYYGRLVYDLDNGESYFYKAFENNNSALIGETGKYLIKSNYKSLVIFIRDDWNRYFTSWNGEPGKYGNMKTTWKKTYSIFYIVVTASLILYFVFELYSRRKVKEYEKLKNKSLETDNKLYDLNNEFNNLMQQKNEIENNIVELNMNFSTATEDNKIKIEQLKKNEEEIKELLVRKKKEIISIEHVDNKIIDDIKTKSEKLTSKSLSKEIELLIDKLHNIKKLWQRELNWVERKTLESEVTGHNNKVPFTISQAFILFEKEIILKQAKMCDGYYEDMKLIDMIDLIANNQKLNREIVNILHEIRKARNDWSHTGKLPSSDIIDHLMTVLNFYKIEPVL